MSESKLGRYDFDGYDEVTTALRELLNQYPNLADGDEISFAVLSEDGGKAMFPITGAVIETERESITGHVRQVCLYPFHVVYRVAGISENQKALVKEWLDNLGRWLEKQPISVNGESITLLEYPPLSRNREFLSISRQTPANLDSINENASENWVIYISARYQNEFER